VKCEKRTIAGLTSSTGSVILGGFLAAARQASKASGRPLADHKVVFLGGGSAAVG
jgi:malate dehydrogenase (oxaloacetate-decarboxylating)(NADP+)